MANDNNNTISSSQKEMEGSFDELKTILHEDFNLNLEKEKVRDIGESLTGYADILMEIYQENGIL